MRNENANRTSRVAHRVAAALTTALLAVAGLAVPAALQVAPAQAASAARAVPGDFDAQVLHYTNVERKKHGLRSLHVGGCVDRFAARHTARLASQDRMYHQRLRPVLRACGKRTAGENLAWRSPSLSAQEVVRMWMKSPGHRRNILNPRYKFVGVDAFKNARTGRVYAGQVFGG